MRGRRHQPPAQEIYAQQEAGIGRRSKSQAFHPSPMLVRHGQQATVQDPSALWRRHFEEQEDGVELSPQLLLDYCWQRQTRRTIVAGLDKVPTLVELEAPLLQCQIAGARDTQ